jgi:YgiT-type zinc finger domain-containing protein
MLVKCDYCGKAGAKRAFSTRSFGKDSELLVIQNVPVVSCPHCKEVYLTAKTMHEIDRILTHRRDFAKKRPVAVAEFA